MMQFPTWKVALIAGILILGTLLALPNAFKPSFMGVAPTPTNSSAPADIAEYNAEVAAARESWWPGFLPKNQVNLGLDLRGGVYLLMEIDPDEVASNRLTAVAAEVADAFNPNSENRIRQRTSIEADRVIINLTDPGDEARALDRLRRDVQTQVGTTAGGPDLIDYRALTGGRIEVTIADGAKQTLAREALRKTMKIVRLRVDPDGVSEISVQPQGDTRIILEAPGEPDPARLKELLSQAGKLTFNLVDPSPTAVEVAQRNGAPIGKQLLSSAEDGQLYVVESTPIVQGSDVASASRGIDPDDNTPAVDFTLTGNGKKRFSTATQRNINRLFAIILDDNIMSAPIIREPIYGGRVQISGNFTITEAEDLAAIIEAGELPAKVAFIQERTVGPTLGEDSIRAGTTASLIGLSLVAVFMIIAYGLLGVFAVLSLIANITLILGALSGIGATLTLPGIAGIILTIGMAVDANVLVFERVREEKRAGRSPMTAVQAGYERALSTILDANITTFIAAAILYLLGSGPVKGFAVTLAIGIVTSVFTAFVVTRWITVMYLRGFRPKSLNV